MTPRPWRDIIAPHQDVLEGTFQDAKFAADLTKVVTGVAPPEYRDPELFFERTFITEGMGLLLQSVAKRLTGRGGDPVVQLQTAFGGGKTHTMMAVLHVARGQAPLSRLQGLPELFGKIGINELPPGHVAVLDGNALGPSSPRTHGNVTVHTLWGELGWQLGGADGYALVASADQAGTSPGKEVLAQLFTRYAPCVVLMDETLAYLRQFEPQKSYPGGTYNSNLSFLQALTEAAAGVPTAMVLASLPESRMEVGDDYAQSTLDALKKHFGRIEAVWKPVATEEAFEIVRRRLFGPVGDEAGRDAVCAAFAAMYREGRDMFPTEAHGSGYERRLRASYPIHPEVFERLYEDWSTLPGFQRTRGVLRLMAHIIHSLWRADNRDYLILPGSLPLHDVSVRNELIKYLPTGWDPIVDKDIDGVNAQPRRMDDATPALGSVQACRRTARTVFLGSAPSVAEQKVRGISIERVRLGCAQPGQSVGRYDDALRRLADSLHYFYTGNDRYWFDLRPNLRREMEERMQRFDARLHLYPPLKKRLETLIKPGVIRYRHVFPPSQDVPDKAELRLVVLDPDTPHRRKDMSSPAVQAAREILQKHGDRAREMQNRLIFLAPDMESATMLREQTRRYLAWESIQKDEDLLNLDTHHRKQVAKSLEQAEDRLSRSIHDAYKWLLVPRQEQGSRGGISELLWEEAAIAASAGGFTQAIDDAVTEQEWVIRAWAPVFLRDVLQQWYWREDKPAAYASKVWDDMCRYLYLPRLEKPEVFAKTIGDGIVHREFFGYAMRGNEDGGFEGLLFGQSGTVYVEGQAVLIEPNVAKAAQEMIAVRTARPEGIGTGVGNGSGLGERKPSVGIGVDTRGSGVSGKPDGVNREKVGVSDIPAGEPAGPMMRRFHATVELNAISALMDMSRLMESVVEHFTAVYGTKVTLTLDIDAYSQNGFPTKTQMVVKENCATLKFKNADFEEE